MSSGPLNNNTLMFAGGIDTGTPIDNSIRFNDDDSPALYNFTAGTPDDSKLWGYSVWVKRGNILGALSILLSAGNATTARGYFGFSATDALYFVDYPGATAAEISTQARFRDPGAWYHVVLKYDSAQAVNTDRITIWVNGVEQALTYTNHIELNDSAYFSENAQVHNIGRIAAANANFYDGYMAEAQFIDGVSVSATDFGKFNPEGHWVPKTYTGSYGTNGFHLDFQVAPGTGNGAGTDVSGNANHFTAEQNLAANDQRTDTPTNHCATLNSVKADYSGYWALSNGNLRMAGTAGAAWRGNIEGTMWANSGKWYFETEIISETTPSNFMWGWTQHAAVKGYAVATYPGADEYGWGFQSGGDGTALSYFHNGASAGNSTATFTLSATDVLGIAVDIDAGKLWFRYNGTWVDGGDPGAGTGANITDSTISDFLGVPTFANYSSTVVVEARFNEDDLTGSIPEGFKTFQVSSLTDADDAPIPKASDYFDIRTWTGDDSSPKALVTDLDFTPDLIWAKNRSAADWHYLEDTVRGANLRISPNDPAAENSNSGQGYISAHDAAGFTATIGSTAFGNLNANAENYVGWFWREAPKAGFDIVSYTGTGVAKAEAHGLGVVPDFIIVKNLDFSVSWPVLHMDTTSAGNPVTDEETDYLVVDGPGVLTDDATVWNDTAPDASDFTVGTHNGTNRSTDAHIAYVWSEVKGFSKFGHYEGNGNADGPFIWTGFRPRFLLVKRLYVSNDWVLWDADRADVAGANPVDQYLLPSGPAAEASGVAIDFLSNGFKLRTTAAGSNANSGDYVFMAFAEHPFKYARAF